MRWLMQTLLGRRRPIPEQPGPPDGGAMQAQVQEDQARVDEVHLRAVRLLRNNGFGEALGHAMGEKR